MLASLNNNQFAINAYHLLMVLKQRVEQGAYHCVLSQWLQQLSTQWLDSLAEMDTAKSDESHSRINIGSGGTPALNKYSQNLTESARQGG
nr:hypothetical protein [Shewanella psychropiezotolerans]